MLKTKNFLDNVKCAKCISGCKATHFFPICQHSFCDCCFNSLNRQHYGRTCDYKCSVCLFSQSNPVKFADVKLEIEDHIKKNDELSSSKKISEEELKKQIGLLEKEKEVSKKHEEELKVIEKKLEDKNEENASLKQKHESMEEDLHERIELLEKEKYALKKHAEELKVIEKQLGDTNEEIATLKKKQESMKYELNERIGLLENEKEVSKKYAEEVDVLKQKQKLLEESHKYQHECVECKMRDSEQNMQLCANCHELKFNDLEDVKKHALCAGCAIKKHMRQGHQIVDFFPYMSAHSFSSHSPNIKLKSGELKSAQNSIKDTISGFDALSTNASQLGDILTDMARRSKSTKYQVEFMEQMDMFIDKSKSIHVKADNELKENSKILEETLSSIKDWYNVRMDNCVDDSETIKLPKSSESDGNFENLHVKMEQRFDELKDECVDKLETVDFVTVE